MNFALSQLEQSFIDRGETRDCVDQNFVKFLKKVGGLVYPIPNPIAHKEVEKWLENASINAIVFSGGNDVGSTVFRDKLEYSLLKLAIKNQIPVIGVCRGMQIIAKYFGANLIARDGHAGTEHKVAIDSSKSLVNSYHHFCILDCPADFKILATAEDNTIEAFIHHSNAILGVMWHPERENKFKDRDIKLFRSFLDGSLK